MAPEDRTLRNETYAAVVTAGRVPTAQEVATSTGRDVEAVLAGWRRLHEAHALVLHTSGTEIRMANPFSATPTAHRVFAAGRWWYANCAWDAFGVCAALHTDGRIETSCPDCGSAIRLTVDAGRPDRDDVLFHCLVPAAQWWDDIVFT